MKTVGLTTLGASEMESVRAGVCHFPAPRAAHSAHPVHNRPVESPPAAEARERRARASDRAICHLGLSGLGTGRLLRSLRLRWWSFVLAESNRSWPANFLHFAPRRDDIPRP